MMGLSSSQRRNFRHWLLDSPITVKDIRRYI